MRYNTAILILTLGALSACDMITPPWHADDIKAAAHRPCTCTAGADCDVKWARAQKWLKQYTPLPIASSTPTEIKTAPSPFDSTDIGYVITKAPSPDDKNTFVINIQGSCGNIFGCIPPVRKQKAKFIAFVMQYPPVP